MLQFQAFTRAELEPVFHESILRYLMWGIASDSFAALSRDQAEEAIRSVYPLPIKYDPISRNCQKFAEVLRYRVWEETGWEGIGIVCDYDGGHWYNVALLHEDRKPFFELLEAQTGKWVKKGDPLYEGSTERYDCTNGWLLL